MVIGVSTSRRSDWSGLAEIGRPALFRVSGRRKKMEMIKGTAAQDKNQKMALQPKIDPTIPVDLRCECKRWEGASELYDLIPPKVGPIIVPIVCVAVYIP